MTDESEFPHTVVRPHAATYPDSIRMSAGEVVALGRRDDEWPGWVWCAARDGREGWVPEEFLGPVAEDRAAALRDYDARELTVRPGERVAVLDRAAGWTLCRRGDDVGWVPDCCLLPEGTD